MFIGYEPWEWKYFQLREKFNDIPVNDSLAWKHYPEYRWIYNKYELYIREGTQCVPHGIIPDFPPPYFSKPIINLFGMSKGARVLDEINDGNYAPGHIITPVFRGLQYTIDVECASGVPGKMFPFVTTVTNGQITNFQSVTRIPNKISSRVQEFISNHLNNHTGIVNFEMIDDQIVEVHLRMSSQFAGIYGKTWLQSCVRLYETGDKQMSQIQWTGGHFSTPIRIPWTVASKLKSEQMYDALVKYTNVPNIDVSVTIDPNFSLDDHINDEYSCRIAVINYNQKHIKQANKIIKEIQNETKRTIPC